MPPDAVAGLADRVRSAWRDAGRASEPRIVALVHFGLGDTEHESREALLDDHAPGGPQMAGMVADSALCSPDAVRAAVRAYRDACVDEVLLDATVSGPSQVDLLAEVVPG